MEKYWDENKTVTVRLGDRSGRIRPGVIIRLMVGWRDAGFARVEAVTVKPLQEVKDEDIQGEHPALRKAGALVASLKQTYSDLFRRPIDDREVVTIIRFNRMKSVSENAV